MSTEPGSNQIAPVFSTGDRVRVHDVNPPGHVRTPHYVRGLEGEVIRYCGAFPNPEELAYRRDGLPPVPLYRVRFPCTAVWPDYEGPARDVLEVEIYQHWLERA